MQLLQEVVRPGPAEPAAPLEGAQGIADTEPHRRVDVLLGGHPLATASCARSTIRATVRATIMPGASPMTLTSLPSAWKRPMASASVRGAVSWQADSAILVAFR